MDDCDQRHDVYLANGMFSEAERFFNRSLAQALRKQGLHVFVPQERPANSEKIAVPDAIFSDDYKAIASSTVLLAGIDGDVPDTGVACEIGLARALGIPVVGLWTDFRQGRTGSGRPMLNIFLQGAIEQNGMICRTVDEAADRCARIVAERSLGERARKVVEHFASTQDAMTEALAWLPHSYAPPFNLGAEIVCELESARPSPQLVVDLGAGEGWLGDVLRSEWADLDYRAVDPARGRDESPLRGAADAVILSFVLHDIPDQERMLRDAAEMLRPGGSMIIIDLTSEDLPGLYRALWSKLALSARFEQRLSASRVEDLSAVTGLQVATLKLIVRNFQFESRRQLDSYARAFGLDEGLDMPWLPLAPHDQIMTEVAAALDYPFNDRRVFLLCRLTKPSTSP